MKLYQNKYRISSARLAGWDYSTPGAYFVTICVHQFQPVFGKVVSGEVELNDLGKVADSCWKSIPRHQQQIELSEHLIMPNHVHGIIVINRQKDDKDSHCPINTEMIKASVRLANVQTTLPSNRPANVETMHASSRQRIFSHADCCRSPSAHTNPRYQNGHTRTAMILFNGNPGSSIESFGRNPK
jgi:REP element-mobilizing transposase RayT